MKVFLGGTCNGSLWREELIKMLGPRVEYFNPVVKDWTPECQAQEIYERENCDVCLYVITPKMTGVYSIAEVIDDSNKRPGKTVFCCTENFESHLSKSLDAVGKLVARNGGTWLSNLNEVAKYLNSKSETLRYAKENEIAIEKLSNE